MFMRYGVYVPNAWHYGSIDAITKLATAAEQAGWESFFVWDHLLFGADIPVIDSQIALAAVAGTTSAAKVRRIGSLMTPLARRRPWKVAREIAALQEVSQGRLVTGFCLGQPPEYEFASTELNSPPKRGVALDDALELLERFLSGEEFTWERAPDRVARMGEPARVEAPAFLPRPDPVPPIWIGGCIYRGEEPSPITITSDEYRPHVVDRTIHQPKAPFRRAARFQGVFPIAMPWDNAAPLTPDEVARVVALTFPNGKPPSGYEVVICGRTRGSNAPVKLSDLPRYEEAGLTTWLESPPDLATHDEALAIIDEGPPS
jgi:Luciferase-like monooxygenase